AGTQRRRAVRLNGKGDPVRGIGRPFMKPEGEKGVETSDTIPGKREEAAGLADAVGEPANAFRELCAPIRLEVAVSVKPVGVVDDAAGGEAPGSLESAVAITQ